MMAARAGANLVNMEQIQLLAFTWTPFPLQLDDSIFISHRGMRYANETGRRDETSVGAFQILYGIERHGAGAAPGTPFDIDDATIGPGGVADNNRAQGRTGRFFGFTNCPGTEHLATISATSHRGNLQYIAERIHPGTSAAAITAQNEFVDNVIIEINLFNDLYDLAAAGTGTADRFGRVNFGSRFNDPANPASYFVIETSTVGPVVHHTMGGIEITGDFEVLDVMGEVIPNFYAVGEAIGNFHGTNRLGSGAVTEIITLGRALGYFLDDRY